MTRKIISVILAAMISVGVILGMNYLKTQQISKNKTIEVLSVKKEPSSEVIYVNEHYNEYLDVRNYKPLEYAKIADKQPDQELEAKAAVLVDSKSKEVLYAKNADEHLAPASTTKIATALTAIKILNLKQKITVGDEINFIGAGSSVAGLSMGATLTFEELMQGMLLASGNDAAYVIARAAGEKLLNDNIAYDGQKITTSQAIDRFVREMNINVRDLGLKDTHFTSPDGYDEPAQYTSAMDLSKLGMMALDNEVIREIVGSSNITTEDGRYSWNTTNKLLLKDSPYYYENATGIKAGSTDNAGKCLVSAAVSDNGTCICVVLGSGDEGRYEDSLALLKYFENNK